ncbi:hypothetical protein GCM10022419_134080 [Nonomuraea rosea]|uniref:Sensor domain-containing protein n=1 Tax=Nonomuraea rosea TaxID=638574 RepID=A0ABP7A690_9ACTN
MLLKVCLAVVSLLLVSGIGYVVYKEVFYVRPINPNWSAESAEPTPIPKRLDPTKSGQPVKADADLGQVCTGKYYPDAPEFAGAAPHRVAIADYWGHPVFEDVFALRNPDEPLKVRTKSPAAWVPKNPAKVQAVLCVDRYPTGEERKIGRCKFLGETLPHYKATWDVTLREVASNKVIAFAQMVSDAKCPPTAVVGKDKIVYQGMTDKALYEKFKSYVEN